MPVFQYKAHDRSSNKEIKDTIEAGNQAEAIAQLKKRGLLPIEVREAKARKGGGAKAGGKEGAGGFSFGRVKPRLITEFTRQL